jgi:hypothetical protein
MGSDSTYTNERVSSTVFYALHTHVTLPQSHYFRAKAAECLDRSLAVPDREYQRSYCELAAQWLILAHEADTKNNQKFCGGATANK